MPWRFLGLGFFVLPCFGFSFLTLFCWFFGFSFVVCLGFLLFVFCFFCLFSFILVWFFMLHWFFRGRYRSGLWPYSQNLVLHEWWKITFTGLSQHHGKISSLPFPLLLTTGKSYMFLKHTVFLIFLVVFFGGGVCFFWVFCSDNESFFNGWFSLNFINF